MNYSMYNRCIFYLFKIQLWLTSSFLGSQDQIQIQQTSTILIISQYSNQIQQTYIIINLQKMKVRLKLIEQYPFVITSSTNFMQLSYLCFASKKTCDKLKIQSHAYRKLTNQKFHIVVQILHNILLDQEQQKKNQKGEKRQDEYEHFLNQVYVPFNILDKFISAYQENSSSYIVNIERVALSFDQNSNPICHICQNVKVYVNQGTNYTDIITKIIKNGQFLIQGNNFKIDINLLSELIKVQKPNQLNNFIKTLIQQNSHKKYHNYIEIILQKQQNQSSSQKVQSQLNLTKFVPSKTKIQEIVKSNFISKPFIKTISVTNLYKKIFQHQKYHELLKTFESFTFQNQFFCLYAQKSIGLGSFLHSYSQNKLKKQFKKINCKTFPTKKQFYQTLQSLKHEKESIFFIKNIDWIQKLSQVQDIIQDSIKSIVQKIQIIFQESFKNTFKKYVCVFYFNKNQNFQQMPNKMKEVNFTLTKQEKIHICHLIFDQFQLKMTYQAKQTAINMLVNSVGWSKILEFVKNLKNDMVQSKIDVKQIISIIQKRFSMEAAQNVTQVSWDDIGGLQTAKQEIIQTVLLPTQHPQIFDQWIKPRTGLLFYGPPGTGKTLLGKCIAKQCKMGFISVKGPQLLNMYVGQSEKNVRSVFDRAKQSKPCIVFMDQLDALVPKRGNSSDSNQVIDRIVAQLLTQMDSASQNGIFIIGATNRPDLLDPSILRAGRFDKQIYLGISKNKDDRIKILKAQTRKAVLQKNFNFQKIVDKIPQNFTGADFYGLTSKAMMRAVEKAIQKYQKDNQDPQIVICEQDFEQVIKTVKPSVSESQLSHYQALKQKFS